MKKIQVDMIQHDPQVRFWEWVGVVLCFARLVLDFHILDINIYNAADKRYERVGNSDVSGLFSFLIVFNLLSSLGSLSPTSTYRAEPTTIVVTIHVVVVVLEH